MTANCSYQLTSFEPIVEAIWRIERFHDGWQLWLRHRHYGGLFTDCGVEEYSSLSDLELVDALGAIVMSWPAVNASPYD